MFFISSPAVSSEFFISPREDNPDTQITSPLSEPDCHETAQTQVDMTVCSEKEIGKAEEELKKILEEIRKKYSENPEKLKKMADAQRTWEEFKKSQIELLYFDHGGSAAAMCSNSAGNRMTWQRIEQLKEWLDTEEGDVCGGL